jgi:4-diphosphocytidyl-2-C-methyl-D-erythritol kinase
VSETKTATLRASAKVNLALHVTGRRPDGYHLLDSIAVFTDLADSVAVSPADELSLTLSGPFAAHAPGGPTDLAWRAAEAFFRTAGLPRRAAVRIDKNIPAGAGLGGGSADAAAVLFGLNRISGAPLSARELAAIALSLGADVPMCLVGQALRARGIGEIIDLVENWPGLPLLLVWPGQPVSTPACFGALTSRDNPRLPEPPRATSPADAALWLGECRNDLEASAVSLRPVVGDVLAALRGTEGCLLARMSGSGSACFGLFPTLETAESAAGLIARSHPGWWLAPTLAQSQSVGQA